MKILREKIHVTEAAYNQAEPRDKSLIDILALFTPISAMLVGFAIYYCIYFLLQVWPIAFVMGVCATIAFYYHDTTLLGTFKKSAIYVRLIFSFMLIIFVSIPIKMNMTGIEHIEAKITQAKKEVIENEVKVEIEKLDLEQKRLDRAITIASRNFDRTGKMQELSDARRNLKNFLIKRTNKIQNLTEAANAKKAEIKVTRTQLVGYYAVKMFDSSSPSEMIINIIVLILALLFETLPVLTRMGLEGGHFMRAKEHIETLSVQADEQIWDVDKELLSKNGLKHLPELLLKRGVKTELKKQFRGGFGEDTDKLIALAKAAKLLQDPKPAPAPKATKRKDEELEDEIPEYEY